MEEFSIEGGNGIYGLKSLETFLTSGKNRIVGVSDIFPKTANDSFHKKTVYHVLGATILLDSEHNMGVFTPEHASKTFKLEDYKRMVEMDAYYEGTRGRIEGDSEEIEKDILNSINEVLESSR